MKKVSAIACAIFLGICATSAFANITLSRNTDAPDLNQSNGEDFIGTIYNADYESTENPRVNLYLGRDDRSENTLRGIHLVLDGKDLPVGLSLLSAVAVDTGNTRGTKVVIRGNQIKSGHGQIQTIQIVTDDYWFGSSLRK